MLVTWPPNTTASTPPEDVVVVENCELTGLCDTLVPGCRTVPLLETTQGVTEIETTTVQVEETSTPEEETTISVEDTTTSEVDEIPTPARIFFE